MEHILSYHADRSRICCVLLRSSLIINRIEFDESKSKKKKLCKFIFDEHVIHKRAYTILVYLIYMYVIYAAICELYNFVKYNNH